MFWQWQALREPQQETWMVTAPAGLVSVTAEIKLAVTSLQQFRVWSISFPEKSVEHHNTSFGDQAAETIISL